MSTRMWMRCRMPFFRLIGGNRRFMVGDIKQSIYAFRGADPSVFASYRRALPPLDLSAQTDGASEDNGGRSIYMSDNFRCDEPVIRVTNGICGHLFRACPDSIGYRAEDDLGFSSASRRVCLPRVQIDLLYSEKEDAGDPDQPEADKAARDPEFTHIANRIAELLRGGACLADGRSVRPGDIAVLLRSKTHFRELTAALAAAGIPVGCGELEEADAGQDLLHGADMCYLVNLLRVLDNPDRDVPLAEVLRAPYPGFSLEDLMTVRAAGAGPLWRAVRLGINSRRHRDGSGTRTARGRFCALAGGLSHPVLYAPGRGHPAPFAPGRTRCRTDGAGVPVPVRHRPHCANRQFYRRV